MKSVTAREEHKETGEERKGRLGNRKIGSREWGIGRWEWEEEE